MTKEKENSVKYQGEEEHVSVAQPSFTGERGLCYDWDSGLTSDSVRQTAEELAGSPGVFLMELPKSKLSLWNISMLADKYIGTRKHLRRISLSSCRLDFGWPLEPRHSMLYQQLEATWSANPGLAPGRVLLQRSPGQPASSPLGQDVATLDMSLVEWPGCWPNHLNMWYG